MTSRSLFSVFLLSVALVGCQPKTVPEEESSNVELASEEEYVGQPLEASFMSDAQSFAYTFHYDGNLLQIVDGQFDGAGIVGPSFSVAGGAQIVVKSGSYADVADLVLGAGEPKQVNGLTVYHLSETQGDCGVSTMVIPVSVEALVMTLKTCDGQDAAMGQQALYSLLKELEIKAL